MRYIDVNTPESDESCGVEATAANAALVAGQAVTMVKDHSEVDRYGQLLRYVYVGPAFVNAELVARGFAESIMCAPDTANAAFFDLLQEQVHASGSGCSPTGVLDEAGASPAASRGSDARQEGSTCIEGNISASGEKIYHFPGYASYKETRISASKGERWLVTSAEAEVVG